MSVINKMLRDLDQRQAPGLASQALHGGLSAGAAALGNLSQTRLAPGASARRTRPVVLALACAVLALGVGALWWVSQRVAPVQPEAFAPQSTAPLPVSSASLPAPTPIPALAKTDAAIQVAPTVVSPNAAPADATSASPTPVVATSLPGTTAKRESATLGLRMDTTLSPRKLPDRTGATDRAAPLASDLPKGPTPHEALERAQSLWNSGSREAAIELLQDAVAVTERSGASGVYPQGNSVLMPLVRELTRMQLAESRHSAVWDLLTRLEPQLGAAPDMWAIRGNAAQRLGRHQDSVHAYMTALQSRPNEQRWLLGAAVSLAALGQTTSATEMADKARAVGVVSPEVLAYLRQMGVPLKDK